METSEPNNPIGEVFDRIRRELHREIVGQERLIDRLLVALLADGHVLLEGVPGLAKTKTLTALTQVLEAHMSRIQFTPDILPSDVVGTEVYRPQSGDFITRKGPVFTNLLLADEINRAPAKVQSALLQAMQEREVTIAGIPRPLGPPFHVLATQNPIEMEGTYPLPEAQLDRFLVQIDVDYPSRAVERDILLATTGADLAEVQGVFTAEGLIAAQALVRRMPVGERVVEAILDLVRACRPGQEGASALAGSLSWGPGPRAAQALMLAVRARALLEGRLAPEVADIAALARPVLSHRMALSFAARARGETLGGLIGGISAAVLGLRDAA